MFSTIVRRKSQYREENAGLVSPSLLQIFVTAFPHVLLILFQLPVGGGGAVLVLSELESMAARQQREIAQQRRLLEQREARLAVLRGAQVRENHFFQPKYGNRSGNCSTKLQ